MRPGGNVMVDVPRFATPLVRAIERLGGVRTLFLTHRDDIASHRRFREHFGCETIIHARDAGRETRDAEHPLRGSEPIRYADDLLLIPVPGHTAGSVCLLLRGTHLFTGDHLAFSPELGHPYGFRGACWYDWGEQARSMERVAELSFSWILPGHGHRAHAPLGEMKRWMASCLEWMRRSA